MASSIDETKPTATVATTASVRANFAAAKSEIEALQASVGSLVIGTDVQAYDAGLASIASLTTVADRMIYATGSDAYAVTPLTSFARTILDDSTPAAVRVTIGAGTGDVTGPASATANSLARHTDATTIKGSGWILGDDGTLTGSGPLAMGDFGLSRPVLLDIAETTSAADTGSAYAVSLATANMHRLTLTATTTLTFSDPPATGNAGTLLLEIQQDTAGSRAITWPGSVQWAGGTPPTLTSAGLSVDIFVFTTRNAGATWYGATVGQAFS